MAAKAEAHMGRGWVALSVLLLMSATGYACDDDGAGGAGPTTSTASSGGSGGEAGASSTSTSGGAGGTGGSGGAGGAGGGPMCTGTLTTQYVTGTGFDGAMFDITAIRAVTIERFDANLVTSPDNTHNMEIYARLGGHGGQETNANAWTLVGSALQVASLGAGMATPIPIPINITIQAGETYGFYVTTTDTDGFGVEYSAGTNVGDVFASDTHLQIKEGVGNAYPFMVVSGGAPRVWNGTVHYCP